MKYKYSNRKKVLSPARLFPKGSPQQIDPRIWTITRGCPSFGLGPALESTLAYNTLRVGLFPPGNEPGTFHMQGK